jgi:hypothetical protein
MDDVRNRLDQDLKTVVSRLGHVGGAGAIEERPWTIRDSCPCADEVDGIQGPTRVGRSAWPRANC